MEIKLNKYLEDALANLLKIREEKGKWIDSENNEGILKTLEALSCFLNTSYYYEAIKKIYRNFNTPKIDERILESDIEYILKHIEEKGFSPSPYLDDEFNKLNIKYESGKTDFTDTVGFFVTNSLDLFKYFNEVYKKDYQNIKMRDYLIKAINWLINNAFVKENTAYWSWGKKDYCSDVPSIYFTWVAVVSLSYALKSNYSPLSDKEKEKIIDLLNKTSNWLSVILQEDPQFKGIRWSINYAGYEDTITGRTEALLIYLSNIIYWLNYADIHVEESTINKIFKTIIDIYKTKQLWRIDLSSHTIILPTNLTKLDQEKMIKYEDRAYEYLLLTALTWFYLKLEEKKLIANEEERKIITDYIDYVLNKIIEESDPAIKLWKKDSFLIYMTQRAIEAIIYYITNYEIYSGKLPPTPEEETLKLFMKNIEEIKTKLQDMQDEFLILWRKISEK